LEAGTASVAQPQVTPQISWQICLDSKTPRLQPLCL